MLIFILIRTIRATTSVTMAPSMIMPRETPVLLALETIPYFLVIEIYGEVGRPI